MIPQFPDFKRLELSDRGDVEAMVTDYPPYSDFNFVSLWCWNTDGECAISVLNGNLVIRLNDYLTRQPFLSFLGSNLPAETADALLDFAASANLAPRLRLIPEGPIGSVFDLNRHLVVEEDEGSSDYVLSIAEWVELPGSKYRNKRQAMHHFERTLSPNFIELDLRASATQREIDRMFGLWIVQRERVALDETFNEAVAVRRFFSLDPDVNLHGFGVVVDGRMRGFALNETLNGGYVMGHFWKADTEFHGIYPYLQHHTSVYFQDLGYRYFNIEQDLGKEGLRRSKLSLRPAHFLRKVEISRRPLDVAGAPFRNEGRPRAFAIATK